MKNIVCLIFAAVALPASARIGETKVECVARYGAAVETPDEKTAVFSKAGLSITIAFFENKACGLFIYKIAKDALKRPEELTAAELQTLLDANGGGQEWKDYGTIQLHTWATQDKQRLAYYNKYEHKLSIFTRAYNDRLQAAKDSVEKANLKGL